MVSVVREWFVPNAQQPVHHCSSKMMPLKLFNGACKSFLRLSDVRKKDIKEIYVDRICLGLKLKT